MFNIQLGEPMLGSQDLVKLSFNPIEPKKIVERSSIGISPTYTRVKGRSQEQFKVEFYCEEIQKFNYLVVLKPKLVNDQSQNLGIVPVLLQAETIQPKLVLDKKVDFQGNQTLKFIKWSYGNSERDEQSFYLINDTKTNLVFSLDIDGISII